MKGKVIFVIVLVCIFGCASNVFADVPAIEREALVALYNSTDGDNWTNNDGWKEPPLHTDGFAMPGTECSWYGVTCDGENHVEVFSLNFNNLVGTIPASIENLANLKYLSLYGNQLTGPIPMELGNLAYLETLNLDRNQLTGSIPTELGSLAKLGYLLLGSNQLTGSIPPVLGSLANLEDDQSDFRWNAVYTDNVALRSFLNTKQSGGDWESTQTVAPANLAAGTPTETTVPLTWTPITYTGDFGGYEVYYSTTSGGPYTLFETTDGKTEVSSTVTDLTSGTTYYFVLRTRTNSHANNQNDVYSEYTAEVSASTASTVVQFTLTVNTDGHGSVTLSPSGGTYDDGTVVTLTAVPDSGCKFMAWSDDLTGSTTPETITMDADKTVTATFNCPPDTPTASDPSDEAIFAEGPVTIDTSTFSDPDSDTHTASHWLARRADGVYYRSDYDTSFNTVVTTGELTQHTVSGLSSGMKYVWKVGYKDSGSGETSWSEEYDFKIGTSEADSSVKITSGTEEADFTMVSFVQWPDYSMSSSVFNLTYDKKNFRIGTYDPTHGSGGYVEYGSSLMIEPGKAYWFLARDGLPITVNGIPVSLSDDIDIKLLYNASNENGWNMIGCPNAANYYWDYVEVIEYNPSDGSIVSGPTAITDLPDTNDYIDKRLWCWENGTYYSDATLMEKYEGYWVKAKKANVSLRFKEINQVSLSNPHTMFASLLSTGKRWMKRWIFTSQVAIADSDDSPPRPMGDFSTVSPDSVGGCFIATAAYGSPMERHVTIIRDFRDTYLINSTIGHMFVKAYYHYSPPVADFIATHTVLKAAVRMSLLPMVAFCYSALHVGLALTTCGVLLIFMPLIFFVLIYKRRRV